MPGSAKAAGGRPRRRDGRRLLFELSGFAFVLGIVALWQDASRAPVLRMAAISPAAAAQSIAAGWPQEARDCDRVAAGTDGRDSDDRDALVSALLSLESFARAPLEREFEWLIAQASGFTGIRPPVLSYGPGQIRLSRAVAGASAAAATDKSSAHKAGDIVRQLVSTCGARLHALALLQLPARERPLSRNEILRHATAYNGSRPSVAAEARLSAAIYGEIAYHLVQHYRFAAAAR